MIKSNLNKRLYYYLSLIVIAAYNHNTLRFIYTYIINNIKNIYSLQWGTDAIVCVRKTSLCPTQSKGAE